jgi:hypothetical protein
MKSFSLWLRLLIMMVKFFQHLMEKIFKVVVLLGALAGVALPARAQMAVPPPMPAYQLLSDAQLDQLLGPIALYPDPLIAQILPAATLPTQIVLADRYVSTGGDPNQIDQQPWDASVQALARYPNILQWLDQNLEWTTELGQAFLNQQQDVMDSIQRLRRSAYNLGNLQSTPQQQVIDDGGYIEILPAEPQVIYVPVYQPDVVYYQAAYGAPFITFGTGWPVGVWLNCDFDWHHRNLMVWSRDHPRPANWWHERPDRRDAVMASHTTVWHPVYRPGATLANRGDRGWNNQPVARPATPTAHPPEERPAQPQNVTTIGAHVNTPQPAAAPRQAAIQNRPAPAPAQHYQISSPASTGAFIGIQSSQQTRTYSERGRQSTQTITRPAPVSRPAPSPGGGGGGHGSNPPRH